MSSSQTQPQDQPKKLSDGEIPYVGMKVTLTERIENDQFFIKNAIGRIKDIDGVNIRVSIGGRTRTVLARQLKKTARW